MSDANAGPLEGRVIAIAGATGGLGPSVARACAAAGATIALADRDAGKLDELVADLELPQYRVDSHVVDLLDEEATRAWCAALVARFGSVSGVAHLVGGWRGGEPLETAPLEDWAFLHDLLVRTVQHTSRAFSASLLASGHGRFVLVSSKQAQAPTHTNAAYAAAKAAAEAWTLALADGFATATAEGSGKATANVVVVDAIATPAMREGKGEDAFRTFTDAEDLASAICGVCGDGASAMNGQRVQLHGGSRR
ncbi:SDR family NAD(P)-dependent oxidoreductase [Paraconexibacter sp.]|uniref:SDR family NAD(P)-dependent oxidoreductase n=1 Tax=Paraconexibacter sp. TaxID=2949640 RepID=UPI00356AF062